MSNLERIDSNEFAPVTREESEMVLGGLAAAEASAGYCYSGTRNVIVDGQLEKVDEYETD
jgi:hypothetical protein